VEKRAAKKAPSKIVRQMQNTREKPMRVIQERGRRFGKNVEILTFVDKFL
jgi:hypothetical protein